MTSSIVPFRSSSTQTRRALLAAAALPAIAAAAGEEPDPHPAWFRECAAVIERMNTPGAVEDDDIPELVKEQHELESLIAETPARTLAGVREQVALVARNIVHNQPSELEDDALANVLATLERLAGGSGR